MIFEDKLMKLRKMNGLSQEDLANQINVSRQTVSKWELGQSKPDMNNLIQISKLFNINIEVLTNDELNVDSRYSKETMDAEFGHSSESKKDEMKTSYENYKEYSNQNNKKNILAFIIIILFFAAIIAIVFGLVMLIINNDKDRKSNLEKSQSSSVVVETNQEQIDGDEKQKDKEQSNEVKQNEKNEDEVVPEGSGDNEDVNKKNEDESSKKSEESASSDMKKKQFNSTIEHLYSGTQSKFFVTDLLDKIILSNQNNPNKIIEVEYVDKTTSDAEEIRSIKYNLAEGNYDVILEYDAEGYINKIILRKI